MRNSYPLSQLNVYVRICRNTVLIRFALAMLRLSFAHCCIRNLWRNQIYFACYHFHARDLMNIAHERNVNKHLFRVTIVAERINVCKLSSANIPQLWAKYTCNRKEINPQSLTKLSCLQINSRFSLRSYSVARPFSTDLLRRTPIPITSNTVYIW